MTKIFLILAVATPCLAQSVLFEDFSTIRFSDGSSTTCTAPSWKGDYSAGTTYSKCQFVAYGSGPPNVYVSLVNSNTGNTPPTNTAGVSAYWAVPIMSLYLGGADGAQTMVIQTGATGTLQNTLVATGAFGMYSEFFVNPGSGDWSFPARYLQTWIKSGSWSAGINRMTMQFVCNGNLPSSSGYQPNANESIEIGTYIRPQTYNSPGNAGQHFYHFINPANIYAGQPVYAVLNRRPEHVVTAGAPEPHYDNPEVTNPDMGNNCGAGGTQPCSVDYYDGMTRWYSDQQYNEVAGVTCNMSNLQLNTTSGETDGMTTTGDATVQGYIGTISATYSGSRYEVEWNGPAYVPQVFNIAYATSDIHNLGFLNATSGGTSTSPGDGYMDTFWNSPNMAQVPAFYVAIQPVGVSQFNQILISGGSGNAGGSALANSRVANSTMQ